MKTPRFLLLLSCVLFAGFLVGPNFGEGTPGDGPRSFLPGYAMVLLGLELLPELVRELSGWTLLLVPILLTDVAFLVLPVLFLMRVLHRPRLNQALRLTFICGGCAYVCYLWNFRSSPPEFGAYLWLVAAVTAVKCLACCPTQPTTGPTGGITATGQPIPAATPRSRAPSK